MTNLILDVDGTLVDGDGVYRVWPRPHLQEFLDYCFATYETVSIWTAANWEWFSLVDQTCLQDRNFFFIWTGDKCSVKINRKSFWDSGNLFPEFITIKPLRKVWKSFKTFNRYNTLIIDDTKSTYQQNYGNAIPIPSYKFPMDALEKDRTLLDLMRWLPTLEDRSIRRVEKRFWMYELNYTPGNPEDQNNPLERKDESKTLQIEFDQTKEDV